MPRRLAAPRLAPFLTAALLILLSACDDAPAPEEASPGTAAAERGRAIIDSARAAAGAAALDSTLISFRFRGEHFRLRHPGFGGGGFQYERHFRDSLGRRLRQALTGDTVRYHVEGRAVPLDSAARRSVETAVNSVAYFALLPAPLGDDAVRPRYAGADTLDGVPYYRVRVRFGQQGGGRDWQDRFVYWFDQRDFSMDYFAYAYGLGPGEEYGTRFREAFNVRRRGGLRFADYRNFTARTDSLPPGQLARYGRLLESDSLRFVSTVALYDLRVRRLKETFRIEPF